MRFRRQMKWLLLVAAFAILASAGSLLLREERQPPLPYEDYRGPAGNPPVDPNRPDLLEEPVIEQREP